jgi:hypothetical protein
MELAAVSQQAYPFSVSAAVKWFTRWRNEKTPRDCHGPVCTIIDAIDFTHLLVHCWKSPNRL